MFSPPLLNRTLTAQTLYSVAAGRDTITSPPPPARNPNSTGAFEAFHQFEIKAASILVWP
ncbi:hypothetical protein AKJ16_DCAP03584 [Drosera capensis]